MDRVAQLKSLETDTALQTGLQKATIDSSMNHFGFITLISKH